MLETSDKMQNLPMMNLLSNVWIGEDFLKPIKGISKKKKPMFNVTIYGKKLNNIPLWWKINQGDMFLLL